MNIRINSKRLKSIMARRYQTSNSLARITGISQSSIHSYMNEKSFPNEARLKKIASALNVNYDWLVGTSDNEEILEDMTLIERVSKKLEKLSERELKAVEKLIDELSKKG